MEYSNISNYLMFFSDNSNMCVLVLVGFQWIISSQYIFLFLWMLLFYEYQVL